MNASLKAGDHLSFTIFRRRACPPLGGDKKKGHVLAPVLRPECVSEPNWPLQQLALVCNSMLCLSLYNSTPLLHVPTAL